MDKLIQLIIALILGLFAGAAIAYAAVVIYEKVVKYIDLQQIKQFIREMLLNGKEETKKLLKEKGIRIVNDNVFLNDAKSSIKVKIKEAGGNNVNLSAFIGNSEIVGGKMTGTNGIAPEVAQNKELIFNTI